MERFFYAKKKENQETRVRKQEKKSRQSTIDNRQEKKKGNKQLRPDGNNFKTL